MITDRKTIVVTGGCGYVGSKVAELLATYNHRVIVVDIATPEERSLAFSPAIEFRKHDLRNADDAYEALTDADFVVHLAADIGSLTYMHEHQADILTNNAQIDAALYPALIAHAIPHVLYSSTSMVFQHPPEYPYREEHFKDIKPPTNVYGFSKLIGEYFCQAYASQHGLRYTIVRYHNIYGPGEDAKGSSPGDIHVIPALLEKVFSGQYPLEILGDPSATRPFVFISDAVEATVALVLRALDDDPTVRNTDFNIGTDVYHTIEKLGEEIWRLFGDERPYAFVSVPTTANTALRREVDIEKLRSVLGGWSPQVPLEEGLLHTAEWIRTRRL